MVKIDYKREWGESGTCYSQTISVDFSTLEKITKYFNSVYENGQLDVYTKYCLKPLADTPQQNNRNNTKYYLNLTQLHLLWNIFKDDCKVFKRILNRNTILKWVYER